MSKKFLSVLFGCLMIGGLIFLLGTAGSSDLGRISFEMSIIHNVIGILVTAIGFVGFKILHPGDL